ncbi:hypothetical protein H5P28_15855 [Ruficoccus amylovorans]|uniref:Right-handed parallel beta-helix repeat-containing protein n=1 Tax=Ruficoccus amylovorans TaxID=1804625 RepID=A0A842HH50_9BACT|nr:hypothetical protein [Ruficoccus amylovorans]MBC2595742.1 hypothetical protein [Ruficoccus amylovorans]
MKKIILPLTKGDATPRVRECLKKCSRDSVIVLESGEYHFWPDEASEHYCFISNNQHGLRRIAFPLFDQHKLTIEGNGARLIFHGEIIPFFAENCADIVIRNLAVDWVRPFYSQGQVVAADAGGVDVRIDRERYPYRVDNGRIVFVGEGWESPLTEGVFAFDAQTRAPAYLSGDSLGLGFPPAIDVEAVDEHTVRLLASFPVLPSSGDYLVFRHYKRNCPAIALSRSQRVLLEDVTLHHAGAMGVIAQFCEDVILRRCRVTPSGQRVFSVAADASHFVNCRGRIRLEDCLFENQLDDACNVHGINSRIRKVLDARTVLTERVHHEQHGVEIGLPGDRVVFADNTTLLSYADNEIAAVEAVNARFALVRLSRALPLSLVPGHVMDNTSWTADFTARGCTARRNRARSFLISTPGRVVLEDNDIAAPGSAIKISGDANYWFESGAVRDVLIRGNRFGDCCFGAEPWGRSVISIDPEIEECHLGQPRFHRNIRIVDNSFATFDPSLLLARSVDGLTFSGNSIVRTTTYPSVSPDAPPVRLQGCDNVEIANNTLNGTPVEVTADACLPVEAIRS